MVWLAAGILGAAELTTVAQKSKNLARHTRSVTRSPSTSMSIPAPTVRALVCSLTA